MTTQEGKTLTELVKCRGLIPEGLVPRGEREVAMFGYAKVISDHLKYCSGLPLGTVYWPPHYFSEYHYRAKGTFDDLCSGKNPMAVHADIPRPLKIRGIFSEPYLALPRPFPDRVDREAWLGWGLIEDCHWVLLTLEVIGMDTCKRPFRLTIERVPAAKILEHFTLDKIIERLRNGVEFLRENAESRVKRLRYTETKLRADLDLLDLLTKDSEAVSVS